MLAGDGEGPQEETGDEGPRRKRGWRRFVDEGMERWPDWRRLFDEGSGQRPGQRWFADEGLGRRPSRRRLLDEGLAGEGLLTKVWNDSLRWRFEHCSL